MRVCLRRVHTANVAQDKLQISPADPENDLQICSATTPHGAIAVVKVTQQSNKETRGPIQIQSASLPLRASYQGDGGAETQPDAAEWRGLPHGPEAELAVHRAHRHQRAAGVRICSLQIMVLADGL